MKTIFKIEDGREKFYQWDLNRRILIEDDSIKEVHFCNFYSTESLVVEVINGLAAVPNILLQQDARISVFAFTGDYTRYAASFKVVSKAKPQDYVYTETEIKRWDKLEEQVLEALDNTGYYVPSVGDDGVLSWQRSKNSLPEASSAYIKGDKGDKGERGEKGNKGDTGERGEKGDAYIITESDYQAIAQIAENNLLGRLDRTDRSLEYLWKKSKGVVYDTELVSGSASVVSVPSGAMDYAALRKLGGMSRKGYQILMDVFPKSSSQISVTKSGQYSYAIETLNDGVYRQGNKIQSVSGATGQYTLHAKIVGPGGLIIRFFKNDETKITEVTITANYPARTINVSENFRRIGIVFLGNISVSVPTGTRTEISNIMLEAGNTAHPWEPYADSLLDAPVDVVRVSNTAGDSTNAYPIPQAIRDLCPDYGIGVSADCYNYIDFAAKQYHHVVGKYIFDGTERYLYYDKIGTSSRNVIQIDIKRKPGVGKTLFSTYDFYYNFSADVKHYYVGKTNDSQSGMAELYVFDTFATLDECRTALIGATLYYELATPEIIDLSAVWPDDFDVLQVEAGGTVQYHYPQLDNGYELAVPTELEIMTNVGEVI